MTDDKLSGLKEQVYRDPRPKEYFDRFHERARSREPDYVYELVRTLTTIWGYTAFRARGIAADNVPPDGRVIIAPNHFSFMDHFLCGMFIRRRIRFMAKSQLFKPPMQWIYTHGGVFPVRRGAHDEDAFLTAEAILANGGCIACTRRRAAHGPASSPTRPSPASAGWRSFGRPVVPVAIFGSHRVRNWKRLQFPKVTVQYGEPLRFPVEADPSRERQQEVADEIFAHIKELHAGLEQHGRRGIAQRVRDQQRALRRSKRGTAAPA